MEVVASFSQGRTAAAQCGLFTHKSVPVIFEPPCNIALVNRNLRMTGVPDHNRKGYRGVDKFLARPTSRCILFNGENISFDACLVIQGVSRL